MARIILITKGPCINAKQGGVEAGFRAWAS